MRIPIIEATEPLPVISPEGAGRGWNAIGAAAGEAQNLANMIAKEDAEIRGKFKEADELLTSNKNRGDFALFGQELDRQLDSDPDQINRLPKFVEGAEKKKKEILSTIPDKLFNKKMQLELDKLTVQMSIQQKNKGYIRQNEKTVGEAERLMIETANAGDIDGVKRISQKIVDLGLANESWKVTQDNKAEETGEKSNISLRVNSQDTAIVKALIEDLDKGKYKTINPLERANYRVLAEQNIKTIEKEEEEKKERLKPLELVEDVKTTYKGMGYEVMLKELQNPAYLRSKGATLTQGRQARESLMDDLATEELFDKKRYGVVQDDFLKKLNRGVLTEDEVMKSVLPATGLAQGDKTWFIDKIKDRKLKNLAYTNSNPIVFGETLKSVVMNPTSWDRKKIWDMIGKADKDGNPMGLSPEHAWKIDTIWSNLVKEDPTLSKKYMPFQQSVLRLDEYRKGFFFIEPKEKDSKGNLIVSKEETIENDRLHHIALIQLTDMVEEGQDPNIALGKIMKGFAEKKAKSFWDKLFNLSLPPIQQDVEKVGGWEGSAGVLGVKKYDETATNPNTGEKMGLRKGKWEVIPKREK